MDPLHTGNSESVGTGYDRLAEESVSRAERAKSDIIGVRKFNNWVKRTLLSQHSRRGKVILDLCCGRGGDLHKHKLNGAQFIVMADISRGSLVEAIQRYNDTREEEKAKQYPSIFCIHADCFGVALEPCFIGMEWLQFSLVSCQFSLHYAFESEQRVFMLFRNVVERLATGGRFVCTFPNALEIIRRFLCADGDVFRGRHYYVEIKDKHLKSEKMRIGKVRVDGTDEANEVLHNIVKSISPFGIRYRFFLAEAVHELDEFLVPPTIFEACADSFGLRVVEMLPFHQFKEKYGGGAKLIGPAETDDWEVISLYTACCFELREEKFPRPPLISTPLPLRPIREEDIVSIAPK